MFTELCQGGEAFDYVVNQGRLDESAQSTKMMVWEIVDAIAYCHKHGFVHRDLKLENILLTDDLHVKIIDFGFTKKYQKHKSKE
jgi:serine/threonine protein kinase